MDDSVITRIEKLECSCRRWKAAALVLAAVLLGMLFGESYFFVQHRQALVAMEQLRAREAEERQAEAVARRAAEQLLERKKEW